MTSSVASSAQCTSSKTTNVGCEPQLVEQHRQDLVHRRTAPDHVAEATVGLGRDVGKRPERPRGEELFARATPHAHRVVGVDETSDQRRLADAGLARDQHQPARPGARCNERSLQSRQLLFALQ